ncbi:MAG: glycosyltransferase [Vicingaceae bacterium]|nr:glycosyltransferase [Vicingaceae bacterium]
MTDNKLNILFLASWYPNKVFPKNGNFIQEHAKAVSGLCNVASLHIISKDQENKFDIEKSTTNNLLEIIVYYKKIKGNSPIHKYIKLKRRHEAHLKGYHEILNTINKIDITHLNVTYPAGLFALYLKRRHNIPFVITEHSTAYLPSSKHQFSKLETKWIKEIGSNASLICPVSNDLATNMKTFGVNNYYQVVPNVVNSEVFYALADNKEEAKTKKILHISNLKDEHKNISGILNTIKRLCLKRTDLEFTIAGDGDIDYWKKEAEQLKIPSFVVKFEGEKNPTEVAEMMRNTDLFLLFSNYENLPCVISESLICGTPVLSTNVGGINEMLTNDNGMLIEKGNEEQLESTIELMLDKIGTYNRTQISDTAKKAYSYTSVGEEFLTIYKTILSN